MAQYSSKCLLRTFLTTLKYHNFGLTSTLNIHLALFSFRLEIQTFLLKFRTRIPRSFGTDPAIKRNTSKVAMVKEGVLHQPSAEKDLCGGCMHTYVCISWWYLQVWNHRGEAKQKQKRVGANTQTTLRATWESWGTLRAKRGGGCGLGSTFVRSCFQKRAKERLYI